MGLRALADMSTLARQPAENLPVILLSGHGFRCLLVAHLNPVQECDATAEAMKTNVGYPNPITPKILFFLPV